MQLRGKWLASLLFSACPLREVSQEPLPLKPKIALCATWRFGQEATVQRTSKGGQKEGGAKPHEETPHGKQFPTTLTSVCFAPLPLRSCFSYHRGQKRYMHDEYVLELITVKTTCELHVEDYLKLFFMALTCVSFPNM